MLPLYYTKRKRFAKKNVKLARELFSPGHRGGPSCIAVVVVAAAAAAAAVVVVVVVVVVPARMSGGRYALRRARGDITLRGGCARGRATGAVVSRRIPRTGGRMLVQRGQPGRRPVGRRGREYRGRRRRRA